MKRFFFVSVFSAGFLIFMGAAHAQLNENLTINGYAGWGYGKTDGNKYLLGNEAGEYQNFNMALALSSAPHEKLKVNFSFELRKGQRSQLMQNVQPGISNNVEFDVNYVFAEWFTSDALKLRIGKVKAPFGIYAEVYDVGTIRPFFALPQAVYGTPGPVTESYLGAGLTGSFYNKRGWGIQYNLYAGALYLQKTFQPLKENQYKETIIEPFIPEMIGAKLTCFTPISGMNFGVASYTGEAKFNYNGTTYDDFFIRGQLVALNGHFEYLTGALSLRSEYQYVRNSGDDRRRSSGYIEAAYKLTNHWQLAALYDTQDWDIKDPLYQLALKKRPSLMEHEEWAFGLNYWFSPDFVIKFSYHLINGNVFARKFDLFQSIMSNDFEEKTALTTFGGQFSF